MNRNIKRALLGALVGGGLAVLGAGIAHAADTSGDDGLLSGTQALLSVDAPVTVAGNAISVLGDSSSGDSHTVIPTTTGPAPSGSTSGNDGIASGTQALVDVAVPITVSGNAISVVGDSGTTDSAATAGAPAPTSAGPAPQTSGDDGVVSGTQLIAPVTVPVTISGNAISLIGDAESTDSSTTVPGAASAPGGAITSGEESILGGTQVLAPISLPITIGGNAITLIGDSTTTAPTTGTPGNPGTSGTPGTPGAPGTSGTPGTPGTPGTSGNTAVPTNTGAGGVKIVAADTANGAVRLATTGASDAVAPFLGGLAAVLLGVGALVVARMRRAHLR